MVEADKGSLIHCGALFGTFGIRNISVKNERDPGYLGENNEI